MSKKSSTSSPKDKPPDYAAFLESKSQSGTMSGFTPTWFPDALFPFQQFLTDWTCRKGKAAGFAAPGLGKTPMQLTWCENVLRHTNKPVLLATTLGVSAQTIKEGEKFGIECERSKTGKFSKKCIIVTNQESLLKFNPDDFSGLCFDESGGLADEGSKRTAIVTEFMRRLPYRSLWSATPAPNDFVELGTSSEVLGELGFQDMVTQFFKKQSAVDHRGWGRTKYEMKGHAELGFWRWVCSWSRACRKPSDLGDFDDSRFVLPELIFRDFEVKSATPRKGLLFDVPAVTLREQQEEQRNSLVPRCEKVAKLLNHDQPAIAWVHLNDESELLGRLIPDSVEVSGKDSDDEKEEKFEAFKRGQVRVMITKPTIASRGINWQHCNHMTFFLSHSFTDFFQGYCRCWRFGQTRPVTVDTVSTEGADAVKANRERKIAQNSQMFNNLIQHMHQSIQMGRTAYGTQPERNIPWLSSTK